MKMLHIELLTPAALMTSMHFEKAFALSAGSFDVTNISTGILPPLSGSKCFADFPHVSNRGFSKLL
jgi:hypothetical protein